MKRIIQFLVLLVLPPLALFAQSEFTWTTSSEGIYRDGVPFFLHGQSWSKKTAFTYNEGLSAENTVKQVLTDLHDIGVNAIRIYGSPDQSDWDGSSNYENLIKWIEEWNTANPDSGDPNNAMYYLVQLSPADPQSSISGDLPENSAASFNRAIHDAGNSGSIRQLISSVDEISNGSKYLLGYLIYHELNISSKYIDWFDNIGASGIESFMNEAADAIHDTYAPGKLVAHTGDAKDLADGIYKSIEAMDTKNGNVFSNFDMLGFNLYISTDALLEKNTYYDRIVKRRSLSVNENRAWFIGETGASYDKEADPGSVAAANYSTLAGGANLQLMWEKTKALGNLIGFVMFTVQDNDTQETVNLNSMKQRGHFDYYGDKKALYYFYADVINEISSNERFHSTSSHNIGVKIEDDISTYSLSLRLKNKTETVKEFFYTIHYDDGDSKQRFTEEEEKEYLTLEAGVDTTIVRSITQPADNKLVAVSVNVIKEYSPSNSYLWSREHVLDDAIVTLAGLNLNTDNLPARETSIRVAQEEGNSFRNGLILVKEGQILKLPEGIWKVNFYDLHGRLLYRKKMSSDERLEINQCVSNMTGSLVIYTIKEL